MFSIPSSLAQQLHIEDKNLKIKEERIIERRSFVTCRGCGGKAENDEYDSFNAVGVMQRIRISRCIEKSKCLAYREVVCRDNALPSDNAEFKISDLNVKKYAKLCREHKELVAKSSGMSPKYVGFALRRSSNRKLLTLNECDKLSLAITDAYATVFEALMDLNPAMLKLYPKNDLMSLDVPEEEELLEQLVDVTLSEKELEV